MFQTAGLDINSFSHSIPSLVVQFSVAYAPNGMI